MEDPLTSTSRLGHSPTVGARDVEGVEEMVAWMAVTVGEDTCASIWTPHSGWYKEGVNTDLSTGQLVDSLAWAPGQPNGAKTQNSVRITADTRLLEDIEGHHADCSACLLQRSYTVQLRGGCEDSILERLFYIANTEGGGVSYQGFLGSSITYLALSGMWEARHHTQPGFRARARASAASLALGPHIWTIEGDSSRCSTNNSYTSWLALNGCNDTEFSCRSC